ncbi:ESX secretion-associated protein EspG [Mycobacterium sp. 236(2023)]|uniref:ESX secretion-associated protein EspG n=1 Tax=Mycobacterium sp. 236(2023) TaxID=3038163 RepID=UPI002414F21B|nr:ESX secretion-associated protein EspG [Mycobacterium sp. 236(2023)]MDG4665210.1 ESX secretion-associated protein EspG [Mycobacterium sp. 236(2023)]
MTRRPSLPESIWSELLGTVAVVDLESACEQYGRDVLPYPLGRSRPVGSVWLASRDVAPIDERLADGDLRGIRAWVEALVRADVCVECRVHHVDADTPDLRLHTVSAGETAFVAMQGSDGDGVDVVDIYAVSPDLVGAVVAESVGLVGAGAHPRIAVTRPVSEPDGYGDLDFLAAPTDVSVPQVSVRDVVATGTVQARSQAARQWGTDPALPALQWAQVHADGDYLFDAGDTENAEPVDVETLTAYVNGMIADVTRW